MIIYNRVSFHYSVGFSVTINNIEAELCTLKLITDINEYVISTVCKCVPALVNVPINYQVINVYNISSKSVETEPTTRYQFIELQPIYTEARAFVYDPYSTLPHSFYWMNHVC